MHVLPSVLNLDLSHGIGGVIANCCRWQDKLVREEEPQNRVQNSSAVRPNSQPKRNYRRRATYIHVTVLTNKSG